MGTFFNNIMSSIGLTDILDIAIVAFLVYTVLGFIRETRAEQLAKGLLVLVVVTLLSDIFQPSIFLIVSSIPCPVFEFTITA